MSKDMLLGRGKQMDQDWVSINVAARDQSRTTYHGWQKCPCSGWIWAGELFDIHFSTAVDDPCSLS